MLGYYEILTTSTSEPISLATAKAFLRVTTTADDSLITTCISAARIAAERITNRHLIARTCRVSFPNSCGNGNEIQRAPVVAINSVTKWNAASQSFTAVTGSIFSPSVGFPSIVYPSPIPWSASTPFSVKIEFSSGYADGTLPADLIQALKMHVAFFYENRGDVEAIGEVPIPSAVKKIYRSYRIISTYG